MLEFISKDSIDLTNKIEFYFEDRLIKCFENKRKREITHISLLSFNVDIECIAFEDESDTNKAMCFEEKGGHYVSFSLNVLGLFLSK